MRRPAALLLLLAACTPPAASPPPVDTAAGEAAIAAFWTAYTEAALAENTAALTGMYTEAAAVDVKGVAPVRGRAAIGELYGQMAQGADIQALTITPQYTHVVSAHQVHQAGAYAETVMRAGVAATEYGRYAMSLVHDTDGQWRIAYIMAFTDSTATR